jgi:uncharacterized membrane protein YeaQ/YmgE (transglycosylase-associated protein family)
MRKIGGAGAATSRAAWVVAAASSIGTLGCADQARPPRLPPSGDPGVFYRTHRLEFDGSGLPIGWTWKRGDGEYEWTELADVAAQFPEAEEVYDRANTRGLVIGAIGGIGGGLIGGTLANSLTANDETRMSGETQAILYGTGGGFIVIMIITAIAWDNPAKEFARVYNEELRRSLGLSVPEQERAGTWEPHPVGSGQLGWAF